MNISSQIHHPTSALAGVMQNVLNSENLRSKIINPLNSLLYDEQLKVAHENLAKNYNYPFERLDQILEVDAIFALETLRIISTIAEHDHSITPKIEALVESAMSSKDVTISDIEDYLKGGLKCLEIIAQINIDMLCKSKKNFIVSFINYYM